MTPSSEKQALISCAQARERFEIRGAGLVWRNGPRAGKTAGWNSSDGYLRVQVNGGTFLVHRIVWLITHGVWPEKDIDHRDTDKANNAPTNLRETTETANSQNQIRAHSQNRSGLLGVSMRGPGRFRAAIKVNGVTKRLGTFTTPEEAHTTYVRAKRQFHEGNTL